MFKTIRNAFKVKELRGKILYTFMMLVVIRFGCQLPIPGIETSFFANWFAKQTTDVFGFFNAMTGGSFSSMSIFALSITPYITSSIIIQLLTVGHSRCWSGLAKEGGEEGRKKIASITRYTTVGHRTSAGLRLLHPDQELRPGGERQRQRASGGHRHRPVLHRWFCLPDVAG